MTQTITVLQSTGGCVYPYGNPERSLSLDETIREFEERVNAEIMNGQIPGFTHLYTGQEANAVGVARTSM